MFLKKKKEGRHWKKNNEKIFLYFQFEIKVLEKPRRIRANDFVLAFYSDILTCCKLNFT